MNGMGKKMNIQELIKLHSFQFYFWLISLTVVMNILANQWLMYEANKRINSIYTYNYSFGKTGLLLLIPSFILTILIIKGWNKLIYSDTGRKIGLRKLFDEDGLAIKATYVGAKGFSYLFKKTLKVAWLTVKYSLYGLIAILLSSLTQSSRSTGGTSYSSNSRLNDEHKKRKEKESAEWNAKKTKEDAIYATGQFIKQGNYNQNTHHYDDSANRAKNKIHEANEARKYADKL